MKTKLDKINKEQNIAFRKCQQTSYECPRIQLGWSGWGIYDWISGYLTGRLALEIMKR